MHNRTNEYRANGEHGDRNFQEGVYNRESGYGRDMSRDNGSYGHDMGGRDMSRDNGGYGRDYNRDMGRDNGGYGRDYNRDMGGYDSQNRSWGQREGFQGGMNDRGWQGSPGYQGGNERGTYGSAHGYQGGSQSYQGGNYGGWQGSPSSNYGAQGSQNSNYGGMHDRNPGWQSSHSGNFGGSPGFQGGSFGGSAGYQGGNYGVNDRNSGWQGSQGYGGERGMGSSESDQRGRGPKGYQRSDERIREDVCDRIASQGGLDASDVEVQVSEGEITLTGTVTQRAAKRHLEDVAEAVQGVKEVHNQIRVKSAGSDTSSQGTRHSSSTKDASTAESRGSNHSSVEGVEDRATAKNTKRA